MEDVFKLTERKVGSPNSCFFAVVLDGYVSKFGKKSTYKLGGRVNDTMSGGLKT